MDEANIYGREGDTGHIIIREMYDGGYQLHRFKNKAGEPCSAIYKTDTKFELYSCERCKEQDMLKRFYKNYRGGGSS